MDEILSVSSCLNSLAKSAYDVQGFSKVFIRAFDRIILMKLFGWRKFSKSNHVKFEFKLLIFRKTIKMYVREDFITNEILVHCFMYVFQFSPTEHQLKLRAKGRED